MKYVISCVCLTSWTAFPWPSDPGWAFFRAACDFTKRATLTRPVALSAAARCRGVCKASEPVLPVCFPWCASLLPPAWWRQWKRPLLHALLTQSGRNDSLLYSRNVSWINHFCMKKCCSFRSLGRKHARVSRKGKILHVKEFGDGKKWHCYILC